MNNSGQLYQNRRARPGFIKDPRMIGWIQLQDGTKASVYAYPAVVRADGTRDGVLSLLVSHWSKAGSKIAQEGSGVLRRNNNRPTDLSAHFVGRISFAGVEYAVGAVICTDKCNKMYLKLNLRNIGSWS